MPPAFLIFLLLPPACAAIFHLLRGGSLRQLGLLLLASWIGFGLGQLAGALIGWNGAMLGEIHLLEATIGSLMALMVVSRPSP